MNTKEHPFPIDLSIEFESNYHFTPDYTKEAIANLMNISAVQMVFPFIRSAVNSVVTSALLPPLVLPIIDVRIFNESTQ